MNDIDNFEEKLKKARKNQQQKEPKTTSDSDQNMRAGMRAGTELVAAIAAGALIGLFLDKTFETKPIFFLALLILGVITGFVNVWRTMKNLGTAVGIGYQQKIKEDAEKQKKED